MVPAKAPESRAEVKAVDFEVLEVDMVAKVMRSKAGLLWQFGDGEQPTVRLIGVKAGAFGNALKQSFNTFLKVAMTIKDISLSISA